jgi:hypothetical protein
MATRDAVHRIGAITFLSLGLAVAGVLCTSSAFTATPALINGVYDLPNLGTIQSSILSNPNIDGIAIRIGWNKLEPTDGTFNWTAVDSMITQASSHGKKASISVLAGSSSPQWLYSEGAPTYKWIWDRAWGPSLCTVVTMPLPWDPIFQEKWSNFIAAFGAKYNSNPAVSHVKLTGINSDTAETLLPISVHESINGGQCMGYDDVANWRAVGYTRVKVENAFLQIADEFYRAFPNRESALMQVRCGFPPIDDNGNIIPNAVCDQLITTDLFNLGITNFRRGRFIGQNNGFTGSWIWPLLVTDSAYLDTGYQERSPLAGQFPNAVTLAVNGHAKFIEVYESDLTNSSLQSAIATAHKELMAN